MKKLILVRLVLASLSLSASAQQAVMGQWQNGPNLPFFPVHMHQMPDGKLIIWPGDGGVSGNDPRLLDPLTGTVTPLALPGYDVFCSGHSILPDGRLFVAGGHISNNVGLPSSTIYDPVTNVWIRQQPMNLGRWYPTDQVLPNGDVLVVSGDVDVSTGNNPLPQVWQASTGTWRSLTSAQLNLGLYPTVSLAPNGQAFVSGPSVTTRYLDTTGTGAWTTVGNHVFKGSRDYDSMVMYQPGKILVAGGNDPPTNTAEVIDLYAAIPAWRSVSPMAFARRQMNATMLPDGKVLVTGGTSGPGFSNPDPSLSVYAAEMWDPATEQWTTLASETVPRRYHSLAMLLPDARVLVTGGNGFTQSEIFSPPYLFAGARPTITSVPSSVATGQTIFVGTPDAVNITSASWIRVPSSTHGLSMSQAFSQSTSITQASGGISITSPNDPTMPDGFYMLFILNHGVPSVASVVHVGATTAVYPAPAVTSLSPSSANYGDPPTPVTITGSNFSPLSIVQWDGAPRSTTFVSSTQIRGTLTPADLASVGTGQLNVMTPGAGGGVSSSLTFTVKQTPVPDLSQTGTIIARIMAPTGGGNHDINIIRDRIMPPVGSKDSTKSYDTYSGGAPATDDWIGYQYATPQTFAKVVFQEGINHGDGGFFLNLNVQVRQAGVWVNVPGLTTTPAYPAANDGISYETYTLNFTPISGDAIRIDGAPGGSAYFISVGELQVFGPPNSGGPGNPTLTSISPNTVASGSGPFTVTVNGTNFVSGYTVQWNGAARPTTFVSATQLTAAIPATDVAAAGSAQVTVLNPASGGASTSPVTFTVTASPATLTSISPNTVASGSGPFTVTVNGTNFVSGYTVQWNGATRPTTFVSATQLTAAIPATDVAAAGSAQVTVLNPASGGASTSPVTFTVTATPATLTSISPNTVASGSGPFTVTVNGTNFVSGYTVQWNGAARPTTFVSATQLTAAIPATDVAAAGSAQVTVLNPASGGASTSPVTFTVTASPATLTSISPNTVASGSGPFTVTVNGTNFVSGYTVQWNGATRPTTFVSATQLTAAIPATDVAAAGSAQVTVLNPASGGASTSPVTFTVTASPATLTSISPNTVASGSGPFTVTVNGTNFVSGYTVQWNGATRPTTFVSATQLTAAIPATDVAAAGSAQVTVLNPASGGASTSPVTFTVTATPATLTSISPNTVASGSGPFTVTVNGTNFVSGYTVQWNGATRPTTFVSATQLTAAIPATDVAAAGSAQVTVLNPASGGASTSPVTFTVTATPATLTSISPNTVASGSGPFTVTVNGTNFVSGYTVQWNGATRPTTFVSATQLTAAIPATDVAAAGSAQVTVLNPASGGASTSPVTFIVTQPTLSDLTRAGTIIARITAPTGGGNHNIEVIRDGVMPPVGTIATNQQYDTYSGGAVSTDDWIGYQFPSPQMFSRIVFQEGMNFGNGGWFNSLNVQVRQAGTWVNVSSLSSTPVYPPNDKVGFETYTLDFAPISGDAIRIDGAPGGTAYFISVGELLVYGTPSATPAPSLTSMSPISANSGDSPFKLTLTGTSFGSTSVVQWNGAALPTMYVSPTQVVASVPASDVATAGTATIAIMTPAPGGGTSSTLTFTINQAPVPNLTQTGTIIAKITAPRGGGNHNLEVIRDGDKPPVGTADSSRQYDTMSGGAVSTDDWIGYQYTTPQTFGRVVFQEGRNFSNGGWFKNLTVQVRQSGTWVAVSNVTTTPTYPANDGISFESYTLQFPPVVGDAIRIDGAPGGSSYFISVGELEVYSE